MVRKADKIGPYALFQLVAIRLTGARRLAAVLP